LKLLVALRQLNETLDLRKAGVGGWNSDANLAGAQL
jgi:hypothetical protein